MLQEGKVSSDSALLIDEMCLQKSVQTHGGKLIGKEEKGHFYNGILVIMVVGLKQSVPYVIKACPKTNLSGRWLTDEIEESLSTLSDAGLSTHAIITDNHSTNLTAFKMLIAKYESSTNYYFHFQSKKISTLFDSVHLIRNIRNNLLNAKVFEDKSLRIIYMLVVVKFVGSYFTVFMKRIANCQLI